MSDMATNGRRNGSATSYIVAVVVLATADMGVVLAIEVLRPTQDNAALVIQTLGFGATIIAALLALLKGVETSAALRQTTRDVALANERIAATQVQVREVHQTINSQLTIALANQAEVSYSQGMAAGVAKTSESAAATAATVATEVARKAAEVAALSVRQALAAPGPAAESEAGGQT